MNRKFATVKTMTLAVLFICLLNTDIQAQEDSSRTINAIIQLPKGLSLEDQIYVDINQDGLKDLALSVCNRKKPYERSLRIHYQQNNRLGFKTEPDETISLTSDVIAYAFADTDQNPGAEILLFTANACFGYRLQEENKGKIYKIADFEFLWQIPDPYKVFSWQGAVLDFNNDGRLDFIIPQSDGLRILFQKVSGFISTHLLEMPRGNISDNSNARLNQNRSGFNLSNNSDVDIDQNRTRPNIFGGFGGNALEAENKPLVNVQHSINVPVFTDFDGNGYQDIMIQTSNYLYVWKQETAEPFFTNQYISLDIPNGDNEDVVFGISDNQYILDLNQDKYCDLLLFKRDKTSKKIFTQILIYLNQKNSKNKDALFNEQGMPQQLIKIAGLPGNSQFIDINRDGYPDISFIIFNPDLLEQVETLASKSIKLQFLSFINDKKGRFSRNPDISHKFNVSIEEQNQYGIEPIHFFIDFNKDGLLDVLVRDKNNHIGLRLLSKSKNTIKISDKNIWDMTIPENARIVYEKTNSDMKDVLIIMSPDQIIYVRFK